MNTYIIRLSELGRAMGELAILLEWAFTGVEEMFAHLGLILLLESVELTLVTIEIVIVGLLSQMSHDFSRWVVEVLLGLTVIT
jgi:hypothetical protein